MSKFKISPAAQSILDELLPILQQADGDCGRCEEDRARNAKPGDALEAYGKIGIVVPGRMPSKVPVIARGIVLVRAAEDVGEKERATALPGGAVGGRGDAELPGYRARMDAWWGRSVRAGEVGYLKVGEPWTDDELARLPPEGT
jgi:hypothetical protein